MTSEITLNLVLWAFIVGFFAGFGWALAAWIVGRLTARI